MTPIAGNIISMANAFIAIKAATMDMNSQVCIEKFGCFFVSNMPKKTKLDLPKVSWDQRIFF